MICPACKQEIADGSTVCPICNAYFSSIAPVNTLPVNQNNTDQINGSAPLVNNNQGSTMNEGLNNQNMISPTTINTNTTSPVVIQTGVANPNTQRVVSITSAPQAKINPSTTLQNQVTQNGNVAISKTNEEKKAMKTTDKFFIGVIVVGLIILIYLIISLFTKKEESPPVLTSKKTTTKVTSAISENIGVRSMFNSPVKVGDVTLASIYDPTSEKHYEVDVKGLRFIEGEEAETLANNYATDPLIEGFTWYAFEYQVTFNDLKPLTETGLSPILDSKVYKSNGAYYVTYNEKNYILKTYNIYNGKQIKNKESATIKVVYQIPSTEKNYSVCFGDYNKTLGCISKY